MSLGMESAHADGFGGTDYTNIPVNSRGIDQIVPSFNDPNAWLDSPAYSAVQVARMQDDLGDIQYYGYFDLGDSYCYFWSTRDQMYETYYKVGARDDSGVLYCY